MTLYLLDTNAASDVAKANPAVARRLRETPMASLCVSAVTEGELLFGLAKRSGARRLELAVRGFLLHVDVLPWDSAAANRYGPMRAELEREGRSLGPLDLMIAAHAMSVGAILVTNDHAFTQVSNLKIEDWRAP